MNNRICVAVVILAAIVVCTSCGGSQSSSKQQLASGETTPSKGPLADKIGALLDLHEGYIEDEAIDEVFGILEDSLQSAGSLDNLNMALTVAVSPDSCLWACGVERCGFGGNPSRGFDMRTRLLYRGKDSVVCAELEPGRGYVSRIICIDSAKPLYLLVDYQRCMAQGEHHRVMLAGVEISAEGKIVPTRIFGVEGRFSDRISWSWDEYGYDVETDEMKYSANLSDTYGVDYDAESGELRLPYIVEYGEYPIATDARRVYRWNGTRFVEKGVAPLFDLCNDEFHILIEVQHNGDYRYRSWNKNRRVSDAPDLEITHGDRKCWNDSGEIVDYGLYLEDGSEDTPAGYVYIFRNNGYRYEYHTGYSRGRWVDELHIYDSHGELIYNKSFRACDE